MPLHSPVIIQDARPEIVDAPLTFISMMLQGVCCLPFHLLRRSILLLWTNATMQPCNGWMCKTINCWQPAYRFCVVSFESKIFKTFRFVSQNYTRHLHDDWRRWIAFQCLQPAIYSINIHSPVLNIYSPTSTAFLIQVILHNFYDIS